jgi:hypothetical protein
MLHRAGWHSANAREFYVKRSRFEFMTDSDYTDSGFSWFSLVPPENAAMRPILGYYHNLPNPTHLIIHHSTIEAV